MSNLVKFKVKNIMFRDIDSRYTILRATIKEHSLKEHVSKEITIKGYITTVYVGDELEGLANYTLDKNYGYYLSLVDIPKVLIPETEKALAEFIKRRVKGLSVKKALEIVQTLGMEALTIIKRDYTMLMKVDGMKEKKAKKIHEQLIEHQCFEELALFISCLNLPTSLAVKIYEKYGEDSLAIIRTNPYCICYDYEINFIYADKIAKSLGFKSNFNKRIIASIIDFLNNLSISCGHLCIDKQYIVCNINKYLDKIGAFESNNLSKATILKYINILAENNKIVIEKNKTEYVYLLHNNKTENNIVKSLTNILDRELEPFCLKSNIDSFIKSYEHKYFELDNIQKEAIYMTLNNNISILTGGPGTGKTSTTNAIVKCIKEIKPYAKIKLLAPTGRASNRMKEVTNMEASTIHRGLKLKMFDSNKDIELIEDDFLIIDESSMIDAYIFEKLLSVIGDKTRILLIGDVNQLPSVGAGLILKDLIDSNVIPTTKLKTIFRQAKQSTITTNAHKINSGLKTYDKDGIDISNKAGNNFIFINNNNLISMKEKTLQSINRMISKYKFSLNDICILCPMRKGEIGTDELNRLLQETYNPQSSKKAEYKIDSIHLLRVGDRVMQNANNYELEVFNGDVGIITKIYVEVEDGIERYKIEVEYKDKDITYIEDNISEIELAYAITIHKSQGSEFKGIIMPVHSTQNKMLNRNLLYTGITRAKNLCVIISNENTINKSIDKVDVIERISRIKEKLRTKF